MENLKARVEEIILLEEQIGFLVFQREIVVKIGEDVKLDGNVLTSMEYARFLTKEIIQYEEKRNSVIDDILLNYTIDDLYQVYEIVAKEPKDEHKMERLLTLFDLIEQKEERLERGRRWKKLHKKKSLIIVNNMDLFFKEVKFMVVLLILRIMDH